MTCGILIWSRTAKRVLTCEKPAPYMLTVHGDSLIAVCQRHDKRLERAFPGFQIAKRAA